MIYPVKGIIYLYFKLIYLLISSDNKNLCIKRKKKKKFKRTKKKEKRKQEERNNKNKRSCPLNGLKQDDLVNIGKKKT